MKCLFLYVVLVLQANQLLGQSVEFKLMTQFPIGQEEVWTLDGIGNVIISNRDQLKKYSPDGKVVFEQSQKSFGRFDKLESLNSLKFVAFSYQQQKLCFFDNSLTFMETCLELADYNVLNATQFAASSQTDKMWVFDQVNSTLSLLSLFGLNQEQEVKNLMGIVNAEHVVQMSEFDNKLFIVDSLSGVFIFDLYGTLIQKVDVLGVDCIQLIEDNLLILKDNGLVIHNLLTTKEEKIELPSGEYTEFMYTGKEIFIRSKQHIEKYEFLLRN